MKWSTVVVSSSREIRLKFAISINRMHKMLNILCYHIVVVSVTLHQYLLEILHRSDSAHLRKWLFDLKMAVIAYFTWAGCQLTDENDKLLLEKSCVKLQNIFVVVNVERQHFAAEFCYLARAEFFVNTNYYNNAMCAWHSNSHFYIPASLIFYVGSHCGLNLYIYVMCLLSDAPKWK